MTPDELISIIQDALVDQETADTSDYLVAALDAQKVKAAIEASGHCIVPREATDAIEDAMLDTGLVEDGIPRKSASDCAQTVYRAMIEAGAP